MWRSVNDTAIAHRIRRGLRGGVERGRGGRTAWRWRISHDRLTYSSMLAMGTSTSVTTWLMGLSSTGTFLGAFPLSVFLFFLLVVFSTRVLLGPKAFEPELRWMTLPLRVVMTSDAREGVGGDVAGVLYG